MPDFSDPAFIQSLPPSRNAALALGVKYYVGKPCRRFQHVVRLTADKHCAQCECDRRHSPEFKNYQAAYKAKWSLTYVIPPASRAHQSRLVAANIRERCREDPIFNANWRTTLYLAKACVIIRDAVLNNRPFERSRLIPIPRFPQAQWFSLGELHDHYLAIFYGGQSWASYGRDASVQPMRNWCTDHIWPLNLIMQGTPPAITERIVRLDNVRPVFLTDNARKAKADKNLIANFRELLQQGASLEQLSAILPTLPHSLH